MEDVLDEIFENIDFSGESDVDSNNGDTDVVDSIEQIVLHDEIGQEILINQSSNTKNLDCQVDVKFSWSTVDEDPVVMLFIGGSGLTEILA